LTDLSEIFKQEAQRCQKINFLWLYEAATKLEFVKYLLWAQPNNTFSKFEITRLDYVYLIFHSILQPRNQENILRESLPLHLVDVEVLEEVKVGW